MATTNQIPGDFFERSIRLFAATYAPNGWLYCEGQLLQCEIFPELFKTLGTAYGGDGITNFALPDLRDKEKELGGTRHTIFSYLYDFDMDDIYYVSTVLPTTETQEPEDWKFCEGQVLNISDYIALYNVCGINYGGNGEDNFALPDLRALGAKLNTRYMICLKGLFPPRW